MPAPRTEGGNDVYEKLYPTGRADGADRRIVGHPGILFDRLNATNGWGQNMGLFPM
jgi:hypothetical protein